MREEMWRFTLSVCLAVLFVAAGVAVAGEAEAVAPQPPADQSAVWGPWPMVPWDAEPVEASAWAEVLNEPLDLTRKGAAGDQLRYRIRRVNLTLGRQGQVLNRMVAEAELARTLVREVEPNVWAEQCEWRRFAVGNGSTPQDYPEPQEVPQAAGISFEFSPRTFDYVNAAADFGRAGNDASGYMLKVLTMDAMGWDGVMMSVRDETGGAVRIGDIWRTAGFEPWEITSATGEESVGEYHAGEMQIGIAGVTRLRGEPCVLIWFSMEGNKVTQQMDTPQFALDMKATEYFRGQMVASLLDGRLVAMELWGPLPCVMKMGFGGQPATEQPIGAILQQVSMWEVPVAAQEETPSP